MTAPSRPPAPRPSLPMLSIVAGVGLAVWVLGLVHTGVAVFVVAVVCLCIGAGASFGVGDYVGYRRAARQVAALRDYCDSAYSQARRAQAGEADKTGRLYRAENALHEAQAELARLRAERGQEAAREVVDQ
ncbi:hypothetical protein FXF51_01695 [Nonomuraea sp. PA05]|uniref:hypothetical protein n=1 Tax=Nonomuraea sp. PA05 TaxID=2604466 RepID=UPI0011D37997|nr:hypothetical protein [Nonomuraea sp. PA05]TYB71175.1 hypothetical protein FXF51_01695 [Nonomuraea sp. PA05]